MLDPSQYKNVVDISKEIDKKVTIKFLKEKKTSRTYIQGIDGFLQQEKIDEMVKDLKKKLGTGLFKNENGYGFQGDHRDNIKKYLLSNTTIPDAKIKIN